jgi:hypothetical protein
LAFPLQKSEKIGLLITLLGLCLVVLITIAQYVMGQQKFKQNIATSQFS